MGWVTLDDGQHVFIGAGGKVLASRSAISSAGGAKERGKSLAARSKAAIGKATGKVRAAAHNEAQAKGLAKDIIASHGKDALKEVGRRLDRSAQYDRSVQGKDWQPSQQTNNLVAAKEHVQKHFESSTTRAIEHAKELATPVRDPTGARISEPPRTEPDAKGNFHVPDKQLGKAVSTGMSKEGMATFSWDKPSTTRAIEHAKEMAGIRKGATDAQQSVAGEIKTAQVVGRARTARAGKAGVIDAQNRMKAGQERMAKAKAILGSKINDTAYLKSIARDEAMNRTPGTKQWAAKEYLAGRGTVQDASYDLPREQIKANAQSPATTRAIEHAKAAKPRKK